MTVKPKRKSTPGKTVPAPERVVRLTFRLRYHTNFGQSLFLTGDHELFGNGSAERAIPLQYLNEEFWQTTINVTAGKDHPGAIPYHYFVRETDGSLTSDWGADRGIDPSGLTQDEVLLIDSWNYEGFYENAFYTKPFQGVLLPQNHARLKTTAPDVVTHVLKVKAPLLAANETVCLVGDGLALRNWNTSDPVLLDKVPGQNFFTAPLDLTQAAFPLTYKYGVYDTTAFKLLRLEDGKPRVLQDTVQANKQTIVNDGFVVLPANTWKGAGIAVPVFSLRSDASFGAGEFTDLKLLVDWAVLAGLKLVQILPVNDTMATHTWTDSYPYSAISAFALHPLYLNLDKITDKANQRWLKSLEPERKRLNALDAVDYEAVVKAKLTFIKKIFPSQKAATFAGEDYRAFFAHNKHWLVPYAAFSLLRDKYGTADFNQWPQHRTCQPKEVAALTGPRSPARDDIELQYFIQYHLHCQLKEATDYAHSQGIAVKGDLPIGVYRYSADTWQHPELFHMELQAGAPPDAFAAKGQNWGFPLYNWPVMKETQFGWWKQRCEQMSNYFDAFRIDHILGFFRIWSIPIHAVEGVMGYFIPAIPVQIGEFSDHGIPFDYARFAKPYVTDQVLSEVFNNDSGEVKRQFLSAEVAGFYNLLPDFSTQRQVENYFAVLEDNEHNRNIKQGLYKLISNVILFDASGLPGRQFHFQFCMADTSSFKNLPAATQSKLKDLYQNYFFQRQDDFWKQEAMQKLPAMKRVTNMLVCGEDLGLVPACVPEVMRQLGLLSLEVQRMAKFPGKEFSYPREAPYLSVVTPSTHDMSTIRGWWEEEDKERLRKFYQTGLNQPGEPPPVCEGWINRAIIIQHLESPAMWSIFQLQDLLGMDEKLRRRNPQEERINVPDNPKHYWRYRMHLTLENLARARAFTEELREYVQESGR